MTTEHEETSQHLKTILCTLVLFSTVFSINPYGWVARPRTIVMTLVALVWLFSRLRKRMIRTVISRLDAYWIISTAVVLLYTAMVTWANRPTGQETALGPAFNFLAFTAIYPLLLMSTFRDVSFFAECMTYATTIHAIIVLVSFFSPSFRASLQLTLDMDWRRYNWRIVGLGIAGAGGSVYLYSGLICTGYLLLFCQQRRTRFHVCFLITFVSIALVGRTGFYCAIALALYCLVYRLKYEWNNIQYLVRSALVMLLVTAILIFGAKTYTVNEPLLDYSLGRLFEIFEGDWVDTFRQMSRTLPPLQSNLLGTGVVRGITNSGYDIQHDGGYAKRYASIGVVGSVISYSTFIVYVLWLATRLPTQIRHFIIFNLILLQMIEYKEPFTYMLAYPFTLIMLSRLRYKSKPHKTT